MDVKSGHTARQALQEWLKKEQISANELARRCSSSTIKFHAKQILRVLDEDRLPSPQLAAALEKVAGIKSESWDEAPPESGTQAIDLPTLQGTPVERLRILEAWCEARTRSGAGLPLDLDRSVKGIQASLRAQIAAKPIPALHEHPDWPTAIEAILDAIEPFEGAIAAVLATLRRQSEQQEAA